MRRFMVVCFAVLAAFAVLAGVRQEASSATDSQVVDNSDKDRFVASKGWKKADSGEGINGDDYLVARPAKKGSDAVFEVDVPENGVYAVYVRWPKVRGLNDRAPVGVETAYGTKWTEVDQRKRGGEWVRVGEFEMREDDGFPIRISSNAKGKGKVAADAVRIEMVSSYEEEPATTATRAESATASETMRTAAAATGADVARRAISLANYYRQSGVRYKYAACTSTLMSCTCFTKRVYAAYGFNLPMDEPGQVRYGSPVARAYLRAGDLVYFKENGLSGPITHVGVYVGVNTATGQQMISHASSYFGTTVTSEMRYIYGYAGARRLV